MITLCIAAQKGGVGKTTTAHNVAAALRRAGNRVLCVDLDPQCNLSFAMRAAASPASAHDLIVSGTDARQRTPQGDLVAASPQLSAVDAQLINTTGKEYKLREALRQYERDYAYAVIDTPPALGALTVNALTAAHYLLIPAQADVFSLQGIGQLAQTLDAVQRYCNPELRPAGILLTRYNGRAILSRDVRAMAEDTAARLHTFVYSTTIRECIALREAQASQMDIFDYAPKSKGAADYADAVKEMEGFINGR